ncbi:hypothetical protein [Paraburkholderia elongata]|uniref:Uncharacterized protein n=1 Tax=Paraburkholderia elongata TaxID=2675747 RepID=A0A972NTG9_9BURK|nr:hypothetical protein [Paraburkholderia elongata]NPT58254.1 hypothetical protein [Paraburkholderia elongata]
MNPAVIPAFDGVRTADCPLGNVLVLDNGTVAFIPCAAMYKIGPNTSVALQMLHLAMTPRGLRWGSVVYANTVRQGFVSTLESPTEAERSGQSGRATVDTHSGGVRVARSEQERNALAEVQSAFASGDPSSLLTPEALALEARQRAKLDKKAAKDASDAVDFAHQNWPAATFGLTVKEHDTQLELRFNYDAAVVKAVKASKARWDGLRKTWTLPREHEVAFGKRLKKIALELGKAPRGSDSAAGAIASETARVEALLAEEATKPLAGKIGALEITRSDDCVSRTGSAASRHKYVLNFPYHEQMVNLVRGVPGAQFDRSTSRWEVPLVARKSLQRALNRMRPYAEALAMSAGQETVKATAHNIDTRGSGERRETLAQVGAAANAEKAHARSGTWNVYHFADRSGNGLPRGTYKTRDGRWNVVLQCSKGRFVEDASSVGGSMCHEYQFRLTVRAATELEIDGVVSQQRQGKERRMEAEARERAFQAIDNAFRQFGEWPQRPVVPAEALRYGARLLANVNGEPSLMRSIHEYVIDEQADALWSLSDNGMDGDDWSRNNLVSTVALRLPLRGAEAVVAFLRESNRPLLEKTTPLTVEQVEEWTSRLGKQVD